MIVDLSEQDLRSETVCRGCGKVKSQPRMLVCWDCFKGRTPGKPALKNHLLGWRDWLRKFSLSAPDRILQWCEKNFVGHRVQMAFNDLLDVATGNREGNHFEKAALARIFPDWKQE